MKFLDLEYENREADVAVDKDFQNIKKSGKYLFGEYLERFESNFAKEQNVSSVVCVKNATDALYMTFRLLECEKRTVIVPAFGAYPTVVAAIQAGAKNIIAAPVDDRLTLDLTNIDVPKDSILVPVHLFGNHAEMSHIEKISKDTNSLIVEDCAQSTGIEKSKHSIVAIHSFYPTKPLGCRGDGGAIITDDTDFGRKCKFSRFYGIDESQAITAWGFNSRLDEWQAAFLNSKIDYYKNLNDRRRRNAKIFNTAFESTISYTDNCVYHQYVTLWKNREDAYKNLNNAGVPTMIHYPKMLSDMPYLKDKIKFTNCRRISDHILSVPVGPHLEEYDIEIIFKNLISMRNNATQFNKIVNG